MKEAPLKGIKIIDASSILMVPYCTRLLADLGAEIGRILGEVDLRPSVAAALPAELKLDLPGSLLRFCQFHQA